MIPLGILASSRVAPPAAGGPSSELTYSTGASTGSFNASVPIGSPSDDRQVVVALCSQSTNDAPPGLTINGAAATQDAYYNNRNRIWVLRSAVPKGTTATIAFTMLVTNYNFYVFALYGAAGVVEAGTGVDSVTLAGTAPGDALIAASMGWTNYTAPTWSGDVTFDASEARTPDDSMRGSVASGTATAASSTATVHWASASKTVAFVAYR